MRDRAADYEAPAPWSWESRSTYIIDGDGTETKVFPKGVAEDA